MLDDYKELQNIAYKMISNQVMNNKISHAYIIETNTNKDGLNFAKAFAKVLLCSKNYTNHNKCKDCKQCQVIDDNNFIELKIIEPNGLWITKEQIDDLQNSFMKKAIVGNKKIYIINHFEHMKTNLMDKMLKFIEEPQDGIIAILITDNINNIIDTIISRCQIISLKKNDSILSDDMINNVKIMIDVKKYNNVDITDELIDKVIKFIEYFENNKINTLLFTKELWYDNFKDTLCNELALNIILLFYKDILDYKIDGQVYLFTKYKELINKLSKINSENMLTDKISVIIESIKKIKYNANLNLLIDKLIIELERGTKMIDVVEVLVGKEINPQYCSPGKYELKEGTNIIVKTDKGLQYAVVCKGNYQVKAKEITGVLYKISRIASSDDYHKNKKNVNLETKAFNKCKTLINKYKLNMSLIDAVYTFDHSLLLFQFVSDERVDFRELAKELASIYKTRIELRQVGVRDKAKMIGGCGQCGKELCCRQFLKDFESVSINNVKNQNLSLNPNKINGVCGRLLCCLKYEDDCYKEYRKTMPMLGKTVDTEQGVGKVISIDILKQTYRVDVEGYGIVECEVNGSNK